MTDYIPIAKPKPPPPEDERRCWDCHVALLEHERELCRRCARMDKLRDDRQLAREASDRFSRPRPW